MIFVKGMTIALSLGTVEFAASTGFNNTITTGAIISTAAVIAVAGFFTIRTNIAKTWRENYEGEHQARVAAEEKCLREREEQQIIRHELKTEIAALRLRTDLTVHEAQETARHDEMVLVLKGINARQNDMVAVLSTMHETMGEMAVAIKTINGMEA